MRKIIVSLTASAILAVGAVAGLQGATQANAARSGGADHVVTLVVRPIGGCGGCRPQL